MLTLRILLDESLPRDLAPLIVGHEVTTVRAAGWSGIKNGRLLALAAAQFDVFITADRNIEFQQNLATPPIAIVEWWTMLDGQRFAVQRVGEQDIWRQQISQQHTGSSTILAAQGDEDCLWSGVGQRCDYFLVEVGEADTTPAQ